MKSLRDTKFDLSVNERNFPGISSDANSFKRFLLSIDEERLPYLVQAYFRDRPPAAFADKPMLWQALRAWLSSRINSIGGCSISLWEFGLSGSANIGFSASPKKFGAPFGEQSDLDLFVVNTDLFEAISSEARKFTFSTNQSDRYRDARETVAAQLRRNILIDTKHIPAADQYVLNSIIHNEMSIIIDKLKLEGYTVKPSSVRVYKNWEALARQLKLNLSLLKTNLLNQQVAEGTK